MYLTIRHYRGSGDLDEIMKRVSRGLVPLLRAQPGFRGYWACRSEEGEAFSVTLFEGRDNATAANAAVRKYIVTYLNDLLPEAPDVYAGELGVEAVATADGPDRYISFSVRRGLLPEAELTPRLREVMLPTFEAQPGFRAYFAGRLEGDPDSGLVVSMWDERGHARQGLDKTAEVIRTRMSGLVPEPFARIGGEIQVAARA